MCVPPRMVLVGRCRSFSHLPSFPLLPALWCGEAEDSWGDDGDARWEEPGSLNPQVDSHLPTLGYYTNERELPRSGGLFVTVKRITMTSTGNLFSVWHHPVLRTGCDKGQALLWGQACASSSIPRWALSGKLPSLQALSSIKLFSVRTSGLIFFCDLPKLDGILHSSPCLPTHTSSAYPCVTEWLQSIFIIKSLVSGTLDGWLNGWVKKISSMPITFTCLFLVQISLLRLTPCIFFLSRPC